MITIAASAIESQTLRQGNQVTITAGAIGTVIVEYFDGTAAFAPVLIASAAAQVFGPFNKDIRFRVSALGDCATWVHASAPTQVTVGGSGFAIRTE
jgi:hypothetical protein